VQYPAKLRSVAKQCDKTSVQYDIHLAHLVVHYLGCNVGPIYMKILANINTRIAYEYYRKLILHCLLIQINASVTSQLPDNSCLSSPPNYHLTPKQDYSNWSSMLPEESALL
jgi:hypothetical protein